MAFCPTKNKKIISFLILAFLLAGGIFVWANQVSAFETDIVDIGGPVGPAGGTVGPSQVESPPISDLRLPIIGTVVSTILLIIMKILSGLIHLAGSLVDFSLNFQSFTRAPVVTAGWGVSRDLCNLGFAAILLFMSFATVLGLETYGLKKLLPKLILVALLINFSLVFAGIIIDFSQILTHYFIDAVAGDQGVSANIMNSLSLTRLYDFQKYNDQSFAAKAFKAFMGPELKVIMEQAISCILFVIVAFLFFAMAFFMLSRLVNLWVLLIFMPLACLTYIVNIPGSDKFSWSKWKDKFLKWTFFAPAYAFSIYLAMNIAKQIQADPTTLVPNDPNSPLVQNFKGIGANAQGIFDSGFFKEPSIILQYILVVMILLSALEVAKEVGPVGAKAAEGLVKGVGGKIKGVGKFAAKFAGGKASEWAAKGAEKEGKGGWARFRRGTSYLAPEVWKQAWKARQTQKAREAYPAAVGARQDMLNRVLTWGVPAAVLTLGKRGGLGEKTDFKERALRARRQEERGLIKSNNAEELVAGFEEAKRTKNTSKMAAHLQALTEQNDQNELLRYYKKANKGDYAMDARGFTEFIEKEIKPNMGEQMAYRLGHDLTRMMENNGQWIGRSFGVDPESGKYYVTAPTKEISQKPWEERSPEEKEASMVQAERLAHVEWSKGDPQEQVRKLGRFSIIDESYGPNGETLDNGLSEAGREKIASVLASHANRLNTHTFNNLVFNHFEEVRELNPALYDRLGDMLKEQTKGLTPEQTQEFIELRKMIVAKPSTPPEGEKGHWNPSSWTPDWKPAKSGTEGEPPSEKKEPVKIYTEGEANEAIREQREQQQKEQRRK